MKVRNGFVSNSSSSSFLLSFEPKDSNVKYVKLTENQKKYLLENFSESNDEDEKKAFKLLSKCNDVWLTQFISDCRDEFGKFIDSMNEEDYAHYACGEMSEDPYDPEHFNQIDHDEMSDVHVWIRCEDDKDNFKMSTAELCKFLKKEHKNDMFNVFSFGDRLEISRIDLDDIE